MIFLLLCTLPNEFLRICTLGSEASRSWWDLGKLSPKEWFRLLLAVLAIVSLTTLWGFGMDCWVPSELRRRALGFGS